MRSAIPDSTVQEVYRLGDAGKDLTAIAQTVGLSRMQIAALLAHRARSQHAVLAEGTARSSEPDLAPLALPSPRSRPPSVDAGGRQSGVLTEDRSADTRASAEEVDDETTSGVYLGDDIDYDDPVTWCPADWRAVHNPHLMIVGESGSGKTYAQQCIVAELAQLGLPSVIFDYGQSFERDKLDPQFLKYCTPSEHFVGEEGLPLNPLQIFAKDTKGPVHVATRLADVFDAAFRLGDIQRKVLIDAILQSYARAGIKSDDRVTWSKPAPSVAALRDIIDDLALDKAGYPSHKNAAGLAARLTTFFMLASFQPEHVNWSWEDLIHDQKSRVHVLQFRGLEGKTQRVLIELLLWHLFYQLKSHGQTELRLFCVLDEAHHLSFRENAPISALLREARKFGLGIIFASQQPEDFSPVAYTNSASKLIFRTADPTLKIAKYLVTQSDNSARPDTIATTIAGLKQGTAFFTSRDRGHLVRIADFPKRVTMWAGR